MQYFCLYSLYCVLDPCGLFTTASKFVPLNNINLTPHPHLLVTTISLSVFYTFDFIRFHFYVVSYSTCLPRSDLSQHNVLRVHPCRCKWQDILLSQGWIILHCVCVCIYMYFIYIYVCITFNSVLYLYIVQCVAFWGRLLSPGLMHEIHQYCCVYHFCLCKNVVACSCHNFWGV